MKSLYFSRLYAEEIKKWTLLVTLFFWGASASVLALQNRKEIILIGIESDGKAHLIQERSKISQQHELKSFLTEYLNRRYSYAPSSYRESISLAADLMSNELWEEQKEKILESASRIEKAEISQSFELESLDLVSDSQVEAVLNLRIRERLSERNIRLQVKIKFRAKEDRTDTNPWGYEIEEASDVAL